MSSISSSTTASTQLTALQRQQQLFAQLDANADGAVSQSEFVAGRPADISEAQATALFQKIDTSGDGDLTQAQLTAGLATQPPPQSLASMGTNLSSGVVSSLLKILGVTQRNLGSTATAATDGTDDSDDSQSAVASNPSTQAGFGTSGAVLGTFQSADGSSAPAPVDPISTGKVHGHGGHRHHHAIAGTDTTDDTDTDSDTDDTTASTASSILTATTTTTASPATTDGSNTTDTTSPDALIAQLLKAIESYASNTTATTAATSLISSVV